MPRDSGGTYTLVSGNPVISGTVIASTWANTTMDDIAAEMTDSLSRTGSGGMQAPLKHTNGSESNPSQTFTNDPLTGLYLSAVSDVRMSANATDQMRWINNQTEIWNEADQQWYAVVSTRDTVPDVGTPEMYLPLGNNLVDELSGSLDFSRASATGNTNKSGVVEQLGIDEPAVTVDGLSIYEEFTNLYLWSEDYSNAAWNLQSATLTGGQSSPDGGLNATLFTITTANESAIRQSLVFTIVDNTVSVYAKLGNVATSLTLRYVSFDTSDQAEFDLNTKTVTGSTNSTLTELDDGWFKCTLSTTFTGGDLAGSVYIYTAINSGTAYTSAIGNSMYIWGAQNTETKNPMPYIKTEATAVSRAADIAAIPMMNNMPAVGKPFTIIIEVTDLPLDGSEHVIFNSQSISFLFRRLGSNGKIQFIAGGASYVDTVADYDASGTHRFAVVYLDGVLKLFDQGVLLDSQSSVSNYQLDQSLYLGALDSTPLSQYLNTELQKFSIYHSALTDEQILSLGSAE